MFNGNLPRVINHSYFPNTCRACGEKVNKGDKIVYWDATKYVVHALCYTPNVKFLTDKQFEAAKQRNTADTRTLAQAMRVTRNLDKAQQEYDAFFAQFPHLAPSV